MAVLCATKSETMPPARAQKEGVCGPEASKEAAWAVWTPDRTSWGRRTRNRGEPAKLTEAPQRLSPPSRERLRPEELDWHVYANLDLQDEAEQLELARFLRKVSESARAQRRHNAA
eukprot:scaffold4635_cov267-Pinguiococcus_pyrenoidosus.AAC.5